MVSECRDRLSQVYGVFTLADTTPTQIPTPTKWVCNPFASVSVSVLASPNSVAYYNWTHFLSVSVSVSANVNTPLTLTACDLHLTDTPFEINFALSKAVAFLFFFVSLTDRKRKVLLCVFSAGFALHSAVCQSPVTGEAIDTYLAGGLREKGHSKVAQGTSN